MANADAAHRRLVLLPLAAGLLAGQGGDHELAAPDEPRKLAQDDLPVMLVFVPANDEEPALGSKVRVARSSRPFLELADSALRPVSRRPIAGPSVARLSVAGLSVAGVSMTGLPITRHT